MKNKTQKISDILNMQLLVYTSALNPAVGILLDSLRALEPIVQIEHITSLESLRDRLRRPVGVPSIGILMPASGGELSALANFRHLLRDMRIILVLPNGDGQSATTAHLLRPRYISHCNGGWSDVIAVASRIAETAGTHMANSKMHPRLHHQYWA